MTARCRLCDARFDWPGIRRPLYDDCPNCRGVRRRATPGDKDESRVEQLAAGTGSALTKFVAELTGSQPQVGLADLKQLATLAATPIDQRARTIVEWWRGEDIIKTQLDRKALYSTAALKAARDRTALINSITEMFAAADKLSRAELGVEMDRAKQRIEALRIENERLQLEDEIESRRAMRDSRIRTEQLQEQQKQHAIRVSILPAPVEPDPTTKAVDAERRRLQAAARGREALSRDCVRRVRAVFRSTKMDAAEKAARIRGVLDVYQQEPEDLPRDVQDLLLAVEDDRHA